MLDDTEIELKLKPISREVQLMLKDKSKNNINPYIKMQVKSMSKSLGDVFQFLAQKFKEDVSRIMLFTQEGHMAFEDHGGLPVSVLQQNPGKAITLTYDICDPKKWSEQVTYPDDIPESELVEMLTECMGIVMI